jgi:hypothetical protein
VALINNDPNIDIDAQRKAFEENEASIKLAKELSQGSPVKPRLSKPVTPSQSSLHSKEKEDCRRSTSPSRSPSRKSPRIHTSVTANTSSYTSAMNNMVGTLSHEKHKIGLREQLSSLDTAFNTPTAHGALRRSPRREREVSVGAPSSTPSSSQSSTGLSGKVKSSSLHSPTSSGLKNSPSRGSTSSKSNRRDGDIATSSIAKKRKFGATSPDPKGVKGGEGVKQWNCSSCTYENAPLYLCCEICGQEKC